MKIYFIAACLPLFFYNYNIVSIYIAIRSPHSIRTVPYALYLKLFKSLLCSNYISNLHVHSRVIAIKRDQHCWTGVHTYIFMQYGVFKRVFLKEFFKKKKLWQPNLFTFIYHTVRFAVCKHCQLQNFLNVFFFLLISMIKIKMVDVSSAKRTLIQFSLINESWWVRTQCLRRPFTIYWLIQTGKLTAFWMKFSEFPSIVWIREDYNTLVSSFLNLLYPSSNLIKQCSAIA